MNKYLLKFFVLTFWVWGLTPSLKAQNAYYCRFDGTDDYIKYIDDATLGGMDAATNYTIEAWIYPISGSDEYDRVLQRNNSFNIQMYDGDNNGTVNDWYFVVTDGSNHFFNTEGDATLTLSEWNHIAVINDATAGTLKLFVNGIDVTATGGYSNFTLPASSSNDDLYIGQRGNSSSWFDGYIDEVRLKKVAEDPANLHYHTYDNEYTSDANTAALFHFNEGTGTSTVNEASNSNATLYGGTGIRVWSYVAAHHLPLAYEWTGASSTSWNTAGNWTSGAVPTSTKDILIPNVTNDPAVGSGVSGEFKKARTETSSEITIDATASITTSGNFEIRGNITNNGNITISDDVVVHGNVTNNGTITNSGNFTIETSGSLTNSATGTITTNGPMETKGNYSNSGEFYIGDDFSYSGNYTHSGGTVVYNGSSAQTIVTSSNDYNNLIINNSAGVNLAGNINVAGALTLTSGVLTSTATNKLTLTSAATVSGGSNTAYVDGPMAKVGSGDFVFPVGDGGRISRIGVSSLSGSETFTAEYSNAAPTNNTSFNAPLTKVSLKEYWDLARAGTATASVTLYWDDSKWSGIGNKNDLRIAHYNGSTWDAESGAYSTTGNASLTAVESGSITVTGVSSFSPFSYGTIDNTTNILPVELISFEASVKENAVELLWITASELNNYGFDIQRSADANHWENLGFVEGVGNSNTLQSYRFVDVNPETINYYRLKQIDFDGNFKYSETRVVKSNKILSLNTYPNPVFNTVHTDVKEARTIEIYDVAGRKVHQQIFNSQAVNVSHLQGGYYFIVITKEDGSQSRGEFLKQ